ncbi:hypothetical protein FA13DRAFT_1735688 [Coprinellus micaceus]|uniref:Secreted protein n=1 Tax=Coprinellus micaceus TaxID=71717 RepID=A0A4Y7T3V3_COPMI|nr:hypothetical protein FA13DRAFT_1735688 [Coprinellus micaceus]
MVALTRFIVSICVTTLFWGVRASPYSEDINQRSGIEAAAPYARGIANDGVGGTLDARGGEARAPDGDPTTANYASSSTPGTGWYPGWRRSLGPDRA